MTESDLTRLVQRIIQEQSTDKLVPSVPAKQSVGKLSSTLSKTDSDNWFSSFPCLKEVPQSKRPMVNGNIILKTNASGEAQILLPQSGKNDPNYRYAQEYKPVNGIVGQIKGGGVYYCSSESYAKGMGPQTMKIK